MNERFTIDADRAVESSRLATSEAGARGLSRTTLILFAITCAVAVANIYAAQPLLDAIAASFAIPPARVGLVITLTQAGYAAGLMLIVPLGDLMDGRRLVTGATALSALALVAAATAPTAGVFLAAMIAVGLLAVVVQVLVAATATLARPSERGRSVGLVTGGVVTGILAARFVAGALADLAGWRSVYLVSAGLMLLLSVVLAWRLPKGSRSETAETYAAVLLSVPRLFLHDPLLMSRGVLAFLIFASFSTLWTGLVLPLSAPAHGLNHTQIGLFGFAGLAGVLAAGLAGRLADRRLGQWTTGAGLAVLTLSWLPIALLSQALLWLGLGVILLDFAVQAVHVSNQSLILASHPKAHSRLVGGYMVFYSAGSAVGAIATTTVYAASGWTAVSLLGAAFGVAALIVWRLTLPAAAAPRGGVGNPRGEH